MNQITVQTQVEAIKQVTREVLKSKKEALKFLIDAGIIQGKSTPSRINYTPTAPTRNESTQRKKKS